MTPEPGIPSDHEEYVRLMMDLMVVAFQSDATRVITFMLDHGQSNRYFNFIPNVSGTWHALSHYKNASGKTEDDDGVTSWSSPEEKQRMYSEVIRWHHQQVAYLLERMKSVREPDGRTLLDNATVLYGATLGDGNEHDPHDLPTLVAGRGGDTIRGILKTFRSVVGQSRSTSRSTTIDRLSSMCSLSPSTHIDCTWKRRPRCQRGRRLYIA